MYMRVNEKLSGSCGRTGEIIVPTIFMTLITSD